MNSHGGFGCYIKCLLVFHWVHKNSLGCFLCILVAVFLIAMVLVEQQFLFQRVFLKQALVMIHHLLWRCASSWSLHMLVLASHPVCTEMRVFFSYRKQFSICFSPSSLPSFCHPCGLSFVWYNSKERKLNSFSLFSFWKYNSDYNVCMKQMLYFANNILSQSKWIIFGQPALRRRVLKSCPYEAIMSLWHW